MSIQPSCSPAAGLCPSANWKTTLRQLTAAPQGHILTNIGCWSSDGQWIIYDTRSDPAGSVFDGTTIERVHVTTGNVERLVTAQHGSNIGVVTAHPVDDRIVYIQGPEPPSSDFPYGAARRRGVVASTRSLTQVNLDAVCLAEPFLPGSLRGGSHVHTFHPTAPLVAFTYEDHVLEQQMGRDGAELNQRNVGISWLNKPVSVHRHHPRNIDGTSFSVLVTRTVDAPKPGSDEINRAYEDAWIGFGPTAPNPLGSKQPALAFLGDTLSEHGERVTELFTIELPADLTRPSADGPLEGTLKLRPRPPKGTVQRRITRSGQRKFPGISGPRHWPRSSPDGQFIYFLMKDEAGAAQLWRIHPSGEGLQQLSNIESGVSSAFSVSPSGNWIAHISDGCVCVTSTRDGRTIRLTEPTVEESLRPEACVFSPDGKSIAHVREIKMSDRSWNQIFIVTVDGID